MYLSEMSKEELMSFKNENVKLYDDFKAQGLCLNMARGNPCKEQLDLSVDMLKVFDDGQFMRYSNVKPVISFFEQFFYTLLKILRLGKKKLVRKVKTFKVCKH